MGSETPSRSRVLRAWTSGSKFCQPQVGSLNERVSIAATG